MKAAVLFKPNEPLQVVECELDPPKAGEVRVKMKAAGRLPERLAHHERRLALAAADRAGPRGGRRDRRDAGRASPR